MSLPAPDENLTVEMTVGTDGSGRASLPPVAVVPGASLGRFLVIDELGRGGMGVVLRAYDPKLQREVAVKVLRKEALPPETGSASADGSLGWERLVREARAMARVSHPNVVGVHDVELEHEGGAMVVMEYVPGVDLHKWLVDADRSPAEILEAFSAAGRGLLAAHQQGVLHRDFKPSNVLVGEDGTVKVTDFGLARSVSHLESSDVDDSLGGADEGELSKELTQHGIVLGTPRYMPPEQIRGGELDARTDQYAFCVALWRALTGAWPFDSQRAKARAEPPAWPRKAGVPRHVGEAIRRGLQAEPDARWPTLAALLAELARDPGRARRRVAVGAAASLAVVGLWGGKSIEDARKAETCTARGDVVAETWSPQRAEALGRAFGDSGVAFAPSTWARLQPRLDDYARELADARSSVCRQSEIERTLDLATADAAALCLDEHLDGFQTLLEGWQNLGPSDVREALRGASALPPMAMCTDPSHLRHRAAAPDGVTDREQIKALRRRLAASRAAHTTARYDDALSEADAALQGAQTLGWAPLIAEARIVRGGTLEALGRYDEAERELEEAVIVAGGAGQDLLVAKAATALVYVVGEMLARYDDGLRWGRLASMATERLGLEDHVVVATLLNNVGIVQMAKREFDAALASYQESLRLREELLGPDSLETAAALNNVGTAYHARSEYETALTYFERSLEIKEQFLGPDHPEVAGQISNIGNVHAAHGDHVRALEAFRRSLEIRQQALGSEHPSIAPSLGNIARSLELQGNREEARGYYERALKVYEDSLGPRHLDVGRMEHALGTITYDLGQRAESIPHFERALEIREYGGATVRGLAQTRFSLGQAMWEGGGDRKRAHALATQALEEYRSLGEEEQIIAMVVESWLAGHPAP